MIEATQSTAIVVRVLMKGLDSGRGLPGVASTIVVSAAKGGATSFTTINPSITDMGSGWYALSLTTAHTNTLGVMNFHITCPSTFDNDELSMNIIAMNKQDAVRAGLTALPNVTAGALGGLSTNAIRTGTAQGAGNGVNQIVLDAGASNLDGFYSRTVLSIVSGTGAGQSRFVASYTGSTRTASLNKNWVTQPDNTSVFEIVGASNSLLTEGLAQAGSANTITFQSNESTQDDLYKNEWVHVTSGTGAGQTRLITGYVGLTKVATVDTNWKINPDATSVYQILTGATVPVSPVAGVALTSDVTAATATLAADITASTSTLAADITASTATLAADITASTSTILAAIPSAVSIRDAVLDAARSGHVTLGSIGEAISLAAALLQGNFFIDNTDNSSPNGQTAARLRCFHTGAAAAAATAGGSGEGEFATFLVATTYTGPNKISTHRVVQQ